MDQQEKTIRSEDIYSGKILNLRIDRVSIPNGNQAEREIVEHSGGVCILAVTDNNRILLVEQFRKPVEGNLLELPAGKLEKDEDPLECAKRELVEETGYQAESVEYLFSFHTSPGYSNEIIHLYLASDMEEVGVDPDENEIIINHQLEKKDIMKMISTGKIKDSKTIIGLLYYLAVDSDA
ncbi:MAG: NUDIX hydrolase [Halanaerobiales bacterium]